LISMKDWLLTRGVEIALILLVSMVALWLSRIIIRKISSAIVHDIMDTETKKRADTLTSVIRYVLMVVVISVAVFMILGSLGVDITPVLAAAGIVGLAVGFGAQHLVQDIISGFFILLEDQIRIGDVVEIAGKSGLVEKVNLRMIILRDLSGNVHYIRNGTIGTITNMTKQFSFYVFDIGVAYRENVDEVMKIVKQVGAELRGDEEFSCDILDDIEIMGLDRFADSAIMIKARIKTKPIKQWRVGREFNRRLKNQFDASNIEIPFPHMTVYMGEDKNSQSPPLNVNMVNKQN
jgi:moderate conductance mechanosensitive channel